MLKGWFLMFSRRLAKQYVRRCRPYVIGVAGSVGKTSCRMIVTQVLQQRLPSLPIVTSPHNFNSELGLALSVMHITNYTPTVWGAVRVLFVMFGRLLGAWWRTPSPYVVVLEYGVDYAGEMDKELSVVCPNIAVYTATDKVHALQFGDARSIVEEDVKLLLHARDAVCVPLQEKALLAPYLTDLSGDRFWYSFVDSSNEGVQESRHHEDVDDVGAVHTALSVGWSDMRCYLDNGLPHSRFVAQVGSRRYEVTTNLTGAENVGYITLGLLLSRLIAHKYQLSLDSTSSLHFSLSLQAGRLTFLEGVCGTLCVDSTYNASPQSIRAMVRNVRALQRTLYPSSPLWLCLGDMRELGQYTEEEHRLLARDLVALLEPDDRLYLVGDAMCRYFVDELAGGDAAGYIHCATHDARVVGQRVHDDLYALYGSAAQVEDKAQDQDNAKKTTPSPLALMPPVMLRKGSQNTIFMEEGLSYVLSDKDDIMRLPRQSAWRRRVKHTYFAGAPSVDAGTGMIHSILLFCLSIFSVGVLMGCASVDEVDQDQDRFQEQAQQDQRDDQDHEQVQDQDQDEAEHEDDGLVAALYPVCFNDVCKMMEVAVTPAQRQFGLMEREYLPADRGMLFAFPVDGRYSFWMKNTWIPLDMIWLDHTKEVVYIERHVPPCETDMCPSYGPDMPTRYVVEVAAGQADLWGVEVGSSLSWGEIPPAQ